MVSTKASFKINVISKIKAHYPVNSYFIGLFLCFKFIGLLILSNHSDSCGTKSDMSFSIAKLMRYLTYFGDYNVNETSPSFYSVLCGIIYTVILCTLVLVMILLSIGKKKTTKLSFLWEKILIPLISYTLIIVTLFSQHLIEILAKPFILIMINDDSSISPTTLNKSKDFETKLFLSTPVLCAINSIFIILINLSICFFFRFINYPLINPQKNNRLVFSKTSTILLMVIFNLQGIHLISNIFKDSWTINLGQVVLSLFLTTFFILFSVRHYINKDLPNNLLFYFIFFCFYGSIITLILFIRDDTEATTSLCVVKFLIQLILAFISLYLMRVIKSKVYMYHIALNIFSKNKNIHNDYIFELVNLLYECTKDIKNFCRYFDIIETHKTKCKKDDCPCSFFCQAKFYDYFKKRSRFLELKEDLKEKEFEDDFNEMISITENEIVNFIYNLTKNKMLNSVYASNFILLHCDFIFHFRKRHLYALHLTEHYLNKFRSMSLEALLRLIEFKKTMMSKLEQLEVKEKLTKRFLNFMNYYHQMNELTRLLSENCDRFLNVIHLQSFYVELQKNKSKFSSNFENKGGQDIAEKLYKESTKLNKSYKGLCDKLIEYFTDDPLKNPELSYLICNFFICSNKGIPNELRGLFLHVDSFDFVNTFDSFFVEKRFDQPLIFNLISDKTKNKEEFAIEYISQKLCDVLGFSKPELLHRNFHILIPSAFTNQHMLHIKRFIFLEGKFKFDKNTFVLSKDYYYHKIRLTCETLPSLKSDVLVICDISIVDHNDSDKKTYSFILDYETRFLTMNKRFVDKYFLTMEMMTKLEITFCNIFNINFNQFVDNFKDSLNKIKEIDLHSTEQLVNVFSNSDLKVILSVYDKEAKYSIRNTPLAKEVVYVRQKEKLLPTLNKIKKTIEEQEYESTWLRKISGLEMHLGHCPNTHKKSSESISTFYMVVRIKNLGNIPYYYLKIYDQEMIGDNNSPRTKELKGTEMVNIFDSNINNTRHQPKITSLNIRAYKNNINLYNEAKMQTPKLFDDFQRENSFQVNFNESASQLLKEGFENHFSKILREADTNKYTKLKKRYERLEKNKINDDSCFRVLFYLVFCLIFLLTFGFVYNLFYKHDLVQHSKDLFIINSQAIMLKGLVYQVAIFMSTACLRVDLVEPWMVDDVEVPLEVFHQELSDLTYRMFEVYRELNEVVKKNLNIEKVKEIHRVLFEEDEYKILNPDWTLSTRNATFDSQLHHYHYNIAYMGRSDSFKTCRAHNFNFNNLNKDINTEANMEELMYYYISYNLLRVFTKKFEKIIRLSNEVFDSSTKLQFLQFLYFDGCTLIVTFLFILILLMIIRSFKERVGLIISSFLRKNETFPVLEKNLLNLKEVLVNFDRKNCELFEGTDSYKKTIKSTIKETRISLQLDRKPSSHRKKKDEASYKMMNKQNSIIPEEEDKEEIKKYGGNYNLKISRISIFITIGGIIGYIVILITNIIFSLNQLNHINLSNKVSNNFLEKVPKFSEMILYFRSSIMMNSPFVIRVPKEEYVSLQYSNTFNLTISFENDSNYITLGDSKFAHIYYELTLNQMNILYYLSNEAYDNILPITRKEERLLNTKSFCSEINRLNSNETNSEEVPKLCLLLGNGVNEQGINQAIIRLSQETMKSYVDFVLMNGKGDINALLQNLHYLRSKTNVLKFFDPINTFYFTSAIDDMNNEYSSLYSIQTTYALVGLLFNSSFTFLVIFIIIKRLRTVYRTFYDGIEKFKNAI